MACSLVSLASLVDSIRAQNDVTVPSIYDGREGSVATSLPFASSSARAQLVFDGSAIAPNAASLLQLMFRSDNNGDNTLAASTVSNVTVELSETSVAPANVSPTFAANVTGTPVTAFNGSISLPAYTPTLGGIAPWNVAVPLAAPFVFVTAQSNLLVDVTVNELTPVARPYWIDAARAGGAVTRFSPQGPGLPPFQMKFEALGEQGGLVPGGQLGLLFESFSTATGSGFAASGVAAFGLSRLATPLDLGFFGANGQALHLTPIATVPYATSPPVAPPGAAFQSRLAFGIPPDPTLAGKQLYVQSFVIAPHANPLGVAMLDGYELTFADGLPHPSAQIDAADATAAAGVLNRFGSAIVRFTGAFQ